MFVVALLITPLITTHEPPSSEKREAQSVFLGGWCEPFAGMPEEALSLWLS